MERGFAMTDKELRDLLERIEREIRYTEPDDEEGRELLRHLEAEIRAFRSRPESEWREPKGSFVDRMNEAIDHFEITHPSLTNMLSQMLNILSNAGI
jgi:hypothetical protein